jgi:hypothetical protein
MNCAWDGNQRAIWLQQLGLEQYAPAFRENDIVAAVLSELTADDLIGLGVTWIGHRRKLLAAIVRCEKIPQVPVRRSR